MKRLTLFLILLSSCLLLQARDCPRCHGNRQIKTRIGGMGSFGIDTSQMVCPHCGEVIMRSETHWDKCPVCDGTGQVGRHGCHSLAAVQNVEAVVEVIA